MKNRQVRAGNEQSGERWMYQRDFACVVWFRACLRQTEHIHRHNTVINSELDLGDGQRLRNHTPLIHGCSRNISEFTFIRNSRKQRRITMNGRMIEDFGHINVRSRLATVR